MAARKVNDPLVERVVETAAEMMGCVPADFYAGRRDAQVTRPKHAIWYVLHFHGGYAQAKLGRLFGREHSTVTKSIRRVTLRIDHDSETRILVEALVEVLETYRADVSGRPRIGAQREAVRHMATATLEMASAARVTLHQLERTARTYLDLVGTAEGNDEEPIVRSNGRR